MPYIQNALSFTIQTILGLYLVVVVLRLVFQSLRANHRNPVCRMVITLTDHPLRVFRLFTPDLFRIDLACILLAVAVGLVKTLLLAYLSGFPVRISGALALSVSEVLSIATWILIWAILISAVLSWISIQRHHPLAQLVEEIASPVLRPFRRILPSLGGLDLSPILALLALNLVLGLVVHPIQDLGRGLLV